MCTSLNDEGGFEEHHIIAFPLLVLNRYPVVIHTLFSFKSKYRFRYSEK